MRALTLEGSEAAPKPGSNDWADQPTIYLMSLVIFASLEREVQGEGDVFLPALIPALILLHLLASPYTKVEESFNLQAAHDILAYGIPDRDIDDHLRAEYDHMTFPGVVPRTFVGALVLATGSKIAGGMWGVRRQILVRGVLGLLNALALLRFRFAVRRAFGSGVANWYVLLQACQFHTMYYASRTLPNMFALGLSTVALAELLPTAPTTPAAVRKRRRLAIYLLTLTGIIFRSELALLLAAQTTWLLLSRRQHSSTRLSILHEAIPAGLAGLVIGLVVTIPIDSFFWLDFPLWPEWTGFQYNALQGRSTAWGTSPAWWYFLNAVPRLLMNPLSWQVCIPVAVGMRATRGPALDVLAPLLAFIALYSAQPHKEWRFIVYAVPGLTAVAALGANWIWTRRRKTAVYRVLALALVASTLASFAASTAMLAVSRLNYPGADALTALHRRAHGEKKIIRVHVDGLACSTGITRFLELVPPDTLIDGGGGGGGGEAAASAHKRRQRDSLWMYDKTEDAAKLATEDFWARFDYVIVETPESVVGGQWEQVEVVSGFAGVAVVQPGEAIEPVSAASKSRKHGSAVDVAALLELWWRQFSGLARRHVTRGWWVQVRMEPKLRILRKIASHQGVVRID
ncbi:MAG: hypothetical protein M1825_002904 [Sarcosagium campestre]|nr:MAG: hypothetical protein M1825_002904 [Sarcosagium campestre]